MRISYLLARALPGFLVAAVLFSGVSIVPTASAQGASADNPQTIGQYARHFRMYRRDVDDLTELTFRDINEVNQARELVLSYDPSNLSRGWIAHQAIIASRAPGFMDRVRTASERRGQAAFFNSARTSPQYMWDLGTETAAINFVFDGLYQDSSEATAVGEILRDRAMLYMETSYGGRLPRGASNSAQDILVADNSVHRGNGRRYAIAYRSQGIMSQVLELAARLSLDRTDGRSMRATAQLLENEETTRCVRWAQLNLNQCMAATRNQAEEAYCTGRHGVNELSECWGWMVDLAGADHASLD